MSAFEAACLAIGALLIVLVLGMRLGGEIEHRQAIFSFYEARAATGPLSEILTDLASDPRFHQSTRQQAADGASNPAPPARTTAAGRNADEIPDRIHPKSLPIALLRIPNVRLEVPVFGDTSERNLNRGAGWIEGTAAPDDGGNFAVAAHRDRHFRPLKDIAIGDVLELESFESRRGYRVTELSIVEPDDVSPLHPTGAAVVTLVTCYPFYFVGNAPQRYIVRAVAMN